MSAPITYNATDEAESLLKYDAEPTIARFHMSNKLFRLITGPVGCVSADTEVMTPEGWVRIDKWADQPILEWSPDGSTEFKKPLAYIVEPCKTLIHFHGCDVSMVLSAEHRVPFYNEKNEFCVWPAAMFRESYFYFEIPSIFGRRVRFANTDVTIRDIETADGKKYCFTTSTGFFVARHNGNVFCTGNSGKSSGCVIESFLRARSQNVWKGERRSRCLVVRSTFPELEHTTIKTFLKWFPEKDMWNRGYSMKMLWSKPFTAVLRVMLPDKTIVHAEYIFYALDKEDDAEKLKSLEVSWAYINEMRQIEQKVFKTIQERTSRWPPEDEGGLNWWGVFADSNPFDTSHYLYNLFMVDKPPEYELFRQPPAILEVKSADGKVTGYVPNTGQDPRYLAAENVKHQNSKERYWLDLTIGATRDYINVELMGNFGSTAGGKVVYPEFRTEDHVADKDIEPMRGLPIVCAYDYGLCYDDQTEVLTDKGWKLFKDVDKDSDIVASMNPETHESEFVKVNFKVEKPYTGDMLLFASQNMDFCVTPEHMVPNSCRESDVIRFESAESLVGKTASHRFIHMTAKPASGRPMNWQGLPDDLAATFLGWFISEGHCRKVGNSYRIHLYQKKPSESLARLVDDPFWIKIGVCWYHSPVGYDATFPRAIGEALYALGLQDVRRVPEEVKQADHSIAMRFLATYISGDGHIRSRAVKKNGIGRTTMGEIVAATISTNLKDDLHVLAMRVGWHARSVWKKGQTSTMKDGRKIINNGIWIISFKRTKRAEILPEHITRVPYSGTVYCLNVPNHILYVRRNGRTCWNGNSPAIVLAQMTPRGQLIYMDEIVCGMSEKDLKGRDKLRYHGDTGIRNFATNVLKPYLINRYPGMEFIHTGDPMGSQRSPTDESTVIEELARCGIEVSQARTNKFIARKEAVEGFMMKRNGLKISPRCAMLIEGFQKQYKYRQVKKPDGEGYTTEPEKNIWSHVHDAAQYAALRMESDATTGSAIPGFGSSRNASRLIEQSGFNAYS